MNAARFRSLLVAGVLCLFCFYSVDKAKAKDQAPDLGSAFVRNGYRMASLQHSKEKGFTLPAKINGRPAQLAISLSAPLSTVFRQSSGAFRIRERKTGNRLNSALGPSTEEYGLSSDNSLEVTNMVMPATTFVVIDQFHIPAAQWHGIAGLLGEPELYRLAAILDCGNAKLYLRPTGRDDRVSDIIGQMLAARGFVSVPMRINAAHHFEVSCRINQLQSVITIEPSNGVTAISDRVARAARVPLINELHTLTGAGGVRRTSRTGRISEFLIGSFRIPNANVSVSEATFGVLGFHQLQKGGAIIDLGAKRLYLRRRAIDAGH